MFVLSIVPREMRKEEQRFARREGVTTTDGPYAETKEQLGGIQILEARDLNDAVHLVSQQPGFKYGLGPIEIRPVEIIKESEQRRRRNDTSR